MPDPEAEFQEESFAVAYLAPAPSDQSASEPAIEALAPALVLVSEMFAAAIARSYPAPRLGAPSKSLN